MKYKRAIPCTEESHFSTSIDRTFPLSSQRRMQVESSRKTSCIMHMLGWFYIADCIQNFGVRSRTINAEVWLAIYIPTGEWTRSSNCSHKSCRPTCLGYLSTGTGVYRISVYELPHLILSSHNRFSDFQLRFFFCNFGHLEPDTVWERNDAVLCSSE
jgi:hypothetical protein